MCICHAIEGVTDRGVTPVMQKRKRRPKSPLCLFINDERVLLLMCSLKLFEEAQIIF